MERAREEVGRAVGGCEMLGPSLQGGRDWGPGVKECGLERCLGIPGGPVAEPSHRNAGPGTDPGQGYRHPCCNWAVQPNLIKKDV